MKIPKAAQADLERIEAERRAVSEAAGSATFFVHDVGYCAYACTWCQQIQHAKRYDVACPIHGTPSRRARGGKA